MLQGPKASSLPPYHPIFFTLFFSLSLRPIIGLQLLLYLLCCTWNRVKGISKYFFYPLSLQWIKRATYFQIHERAYCPVEMKAVTCLFCKESVPLSQVFNWRHNSEIDIVRAGFSIRFLSLGTIGIWLSNSVLWGHSCILQDI